MAPSYRPQPARLPHPSHFASYHWQSNVQARQHKGVSVSRVLLGKQGYTRWQQWGREDGIESEQLRMVPATCEVEPGLSGHQ
jgi:hypothetical protein